MSSTAPKINAGHANQPYVRLELTNGDSCEIYLQGAHLTSWRCQGEEQLFLSRQAEFAPGKAIRGGVPVIFPQFGAFGPGAKHGFARNRSWQLTAATADSIDFSLLSDEQTLKAWPFTFAAGYRVTLAPGSLFMQLSVTNCAAEPIEFTNALHTYFASPDYRQSTLSGLLGLEYWDNGTPWGERSTQTADGLTLSDALDRVYFQALKPLLWQDQARSLTITAEGFSDAVVWNPGAEGASVLSDMAADEFIHMLCVEAANVAKPTRLLPGETWQGSQRIDLRTA